MATHPPIRFQDIYIAEPCSERWQDMDAVTGGSYCRNCKKVVIDYTQMTEAELNAHFAAGESTGCGRFRIAQIGQAPKAPAPSPTRIMLERWRAGAAAALLFISLWQLPKIGKAESKQVSCLVPRAPAISPNQVSPAANTVISAVLLTYEKENIIADFPITLSLPNGDTISLMTTRGFFSIDLAGRAQPEDSIVLRVTDDYYGDPLVGAEISYTELRFALKDAYHMSVGINARNREILRTDLVVGGLHRGPDLANLPSSMDVIPAKYEARDEGESLFRTKTPEEKALAKANRDAKRATRESDKP